MKYFHTPGNDIRAIEPGQEFLIQDDWTEISGPKPSPHHYLDENYQWVEDSTAALEHRKSKVRAERDHILTLTDRTQVPDSPFDSAAWATYRQELRDLTEQSGFPDSVTWPEPPKALETL